MSGTDRDERKGDRFRRPRFETPRASDEETRLPARSPEVTAREMGMFLEPLSKLAEAFRQNTEALKSIADGQSKISKRLERTDRSEAVIQSTQALNDTFRGVQRTQERLVTRLEEESSRPWLMVAGVAALVLVLVGGLLWFLLGWMAEREEKAGTPGLAALQEELSNRDEMIAGLQNDLLERERRAGDLRQQLERKDAEIEREAERAGTQEAAVAALEKSVADLEEEKRSFADTRARISQLLTERAGLDTKISGLEEEISRLRGELGRVREDVADRDSRIAALDARLRDAALREAGAPTVVPPRTPDAPPPAEPVVATPEDGAEGGAGEVPVGAMTDPAQLSRLRVVLNGLLADSKGAETYEFLAIGGARAKVLYQAVLVNRDESGREIKRIDGRECRIVFYEDQRRAEVRFAGGSLTYYGHKTPFWGNRYVVPVPSIDPVAWERSGLTILEKAK